jgi:hypothetical protein
MKTEQVFTDPKVSLTSQVLKSSLGKLYAIYEKLITTMESERFEATPEWRFYKDGGAWLCRITRKKKTVFWLSAWKSHFTAAFYFTEKTGKGIPDLRIKRAHTLAYTEAPPIGKLKPLIMEISTEAQLEDVFTVADYKIAQ